MPPPPPFIKPEWSSSSWSNHLKVKPEPSSSSSHSFASVKSETTRVKPESPSRPPPTASAGQAAKASRQLLDVPKFPNREDLKSVHPRQSTSGGQRSSASRQQDVKRDNRGLQQVADTKREIPKAKLKPSAKELAAVDRLKLHARIRRFKTAFPDLTYKVAQQTWRKMLAIFKQKNLSVPTQLVYYTPQQRKEILASGHPGTVRHATKGNKAKPRGPRPQGSVYWKNELAPDRRARGMIAQQVNQNDQDELACFTMRKIFPHYTFIPKGNAYITRTAKKLTKEAGEQVYIVRNYTTASLGIQVPEEFYDKAREHEELTKETREYTVAQKDQREQREAILCLQGMLPKIPEAERDKVIERAFEKRSGRVGRTSLLSLPERLRLAVGAHLRHNHTDYEKRLLSAAQTRAMPESNAGRMTRVHNAQQQARKEITDKINEMWTSWNPPVPKFTDPIPDEMTKQQFISKVKAKPSRRGDDDSESDNEDGFIVSDDEDQESSEEEEYDELFDSDGEMGQTDDEDAENDDEDLEAKHVEDSSLDSESSSPMVPIPGRKRLICKAVSPPSKRQRMDMQDSDSDDLYSRPVRVTRSMKARSMSVTGPEESKATVKLELSYTKAMADVQAKVEPGTEEGNVEHVLVKSESPSGLVKKKEDPNGTGVEVICLSD